MTYCVMDNWVYGLTKKQTSPTSPLGFKSKTDQWGAVDYPINPMKQAIAAGATFVARTTHTNPNHVLQMMEAAMDHDGFSFIECLSECVEFYEGAFDASNPRKGGVFNEVPKPRRDRRTRGLQARRRTVPRHFGIFYKVNKPTKNAKEAEINKSFQMEKVTGLKDWQILQKNFDRMMK
jgi:2-oxoglutarate ferredoxin oxidoreductase subunit beta